jgi:site-specific recombinase XerD
MISSRRTEAPGKEGIMSETSKDRAPTSGEGGQPTAYVDGFAAFLCERGYAEHTVEVYVRIANRFARWLLGEGILLDKVEQPAVERFVSKLGRYKPPSRRYAKVPDAACAVRRFAEYIWETIGIEPEGPQLPDATELDLWLQSYNSYLLQACGLATGTRSDYVRYARKLAHGLFECGKHDWGALRADDLTEFVRKEAARLGPTSGRRPATAMRALLRYLTFCGFTLSRLAGAVPVVRRYRDAGLPRHLNQEEVERVLATCDLSTAVGRRDKAILLILAGLGLRAGEVARLRLDDFDWHNGSLVIRAGKTARERCLPIPHEMGAAIVAYLRRGRPCVPERTVFCRVRPPRGPLTRIGITEVAKAALRRAGLHPVRSGAHVFRHTVATQLVRGGASFKSVADLLGHARIETTTIYAKLDMGSLAKVALPWPGGVS